MTMRDTGMNNLRPKTGKLWTYGRTDEGQKTKIVTDRQLDREDRYWGGKGKPDGDGHGHQWNNNRDGQKGTRQPK